MGFFGGWGSPDLFVPKEFLNKPAFYIPLLNDSFNQFIDDGWPSLT